MGSGKTKVGKILNKKLGWPHYDTDRVVEEQSGSSVPDIINKHGEGYFRDMEKQAVREVSKWDHCVISTGGGVPLDPVNMKNLKEDSILIWLKVSPQVVVKRLGSLKSRPLIDPDHPVDSVRRLLEQRKPFYEVAEFRIDTDPLTSDEVAQKILDWFPELIDEKIKN